MPEDFERSCENAKVLIDRRPNAQTIEQFNACCPQFGCSNCNQYPLILYCQTQHIERITFNLFYFVKITTRFDHFIWSSSGEYKMYNML
jgi:hypothetical protein